MFCKRPKPGESDEEILAQETAFLENLRQLNRSGQTGPSFEPAAKVVKKSKDGKDAQTSRAGNEPQEMETNEEETLGHPIEKCLKTVVERAFDPSKLLSFSGQRSLPPMVKLVEKHLNHNDAQGTTTSTRGKSLFARSFDATAGSSTGKIQSKEMPSSSADKIIGDKIHPLLAGMTEREIVEEQRKLMEKLDPKLVEFLKSRKNKKPYVETETMDTKMEVDDNNESETIEDESDLPINPATVKDFPGMDVLEKDKLAWTGLLKNERTTFSKSDVGKIARFDFQGVLLPANAVNDQSTFDKGLHNHGEEMERPGYSLEELLTLSRSRNAQQRVIAFSVIGNIYAHAHTGMYDKIFEQSIFGMVEYMDFIYGIRKGLDEEDVTVVNVAVQCLAKVIYPWEEEICLDVCYLWEDAKPLPWISTKFENMTALEPGVTESDLKDSEILEMDLLEFFIQRSSLLERIEYLLEKGYLVLTENGVQGILKILIRVARHSPDVLMKHKSLLRLIIEKYVPANWINAEVKSTNLSGVPLPLALKMLRLLIDSSQANASKIYSEYNVFSSVLSYIAYDDWASQTSLRWTEALVLESFRIWIALITQGFAMKEYLTFFPVLMKFMMFYQNSDSSSFDLIHFHHVISLLLSIVRMKEDSKGVLDTNKHSHWDLIKDTISFVEQFVVKTLAILSSSNQSIDEGSAFFAVSKGIRLLIEAHKYGLEITKVVSGVKKFLSTDKYQKATSYLRKQSIILMNKEEAERYPSNFASVKAISYGGNLNPLIEHGLSLPLMASIFSLQKLTHSINEDDVINANVKDYVSAILQFNNQSEKSNFFVRFELSYILELSEIHPETTPERFYLLYKAVSEVPKCCSHLFNKLFKLALTSSCTDSDKDSLIQIYEGYLLQDNDTISMDTQDNESESPKKKVRFEEGTNLSSTQLEFTSWTEKCIGSHWILEPIEKIHTIVTNTPSYISNNLSAIENQCRVCLKLIEKCLESYVDFIIQTPKDFLTVYCSICQVFLLGDPRIYIDEVIGPTLRNILRKLTHCKVAADYKTKPLFSKQRRAEGLPNMFFDFYPDLLKEYVNNSYFNETFAAYLMLPIRTPEDYSLKSSFWSLEFLRSIRITLHNSLIPLDFICSAVEKESRLLDIFMKLLHTGTITKDRNEFLFEVIKLNLQNAVNQMDLSDDLKEKFKALKL